MQDKDAKEYIGVEILLNGKRAFIGKIYATRQALEDQVAKDMPNRRIAWEGNLATIF